MTCKTDSKHGLLQLLLSEGCCVLNYLSSNTDTQAVTSGEYGNNISEIRPNRFGGTSEDLS